jgi:hypothetical protein
MVRRFAGCDERGGRLKNTEVRTRLVRRKIKPIEVGKFRPISKELLGRTPAKPHYSPRDVTGSQMPVSISCIECVFMEIEFQNALQ